MLTAFLRAFRTPDLRKKLLFTLFIIAMFRLGSSLRPPACPSARSTPVSTLPPTAAAAAACSSWSTCSAAARC